MAVSVTLFNNIFDNKTDKVTGFETFSQFEEALYHLSTQKRKGKKDATLISPAVYRHNSTRSNDNVVAWSSWCAVDVDDHEFKGDLQSELSERFGGYYFCCYSTASSKDNQPKFRLVFPLKCEVEASKIKHFWHALNTELGQLADRQTKDLSRMYYIPGCYDGANNFIFTNIGDTIDPYELMRKHEYTEKVGGSFLDKLPESLRQQVITYRKEQMDNVSVRWSSYKDCPFFPKTLANEYRMITNTGWYHKMYQIMVATAGNAVKNKYPITPEEITELCRELDNETGDWYKSRPIEKEANRAIEYVYRNV